MILAACGGQKTATTTAPSPYTRPPIREVSEAQLKQEATFIDALTLLHTERVDEALAAFAAITSADPTQAAAWFEQGQLLLHRGWVDSALRCTERAVALNDTNRWYLLALAQQYGHRSNAKQLAHTWERIVALQPNVLENYYELSNAYISCGELERAIEVLNRVERRVGPSEPVSLQKQRLWNAAGKPDKALHELEVLADAMPREKRYQAMLAQSYMGQKKYAKAKTCYDHVLAIDPQDEYIHLQLADYYKTIGQPAEADSEMVMAFANPRLDGSTKAQVLGQFYTQEEFYGSRSGVTYRLLDMLMQQSDNPTDYAPFYADVLMHQNRFDEAAEQLKVDLTRDSSQYALWEALLVSLASCENREAETALYAARAAHLFPTHTLPRYLLALQAVREERYQDALTQLEKSERWGYSKGYLEAECVGLLAEAYYRTAQYSRAWQYFERYLQLRPQDWGMMNNYAYYLSEQGQRLEKALEMSRRTVEADPDNANSLDTYAWLLHLLGRDAEALQPMQKAVRLDPTSDTLRRHLEQIQSR